jgi:ribosomal-protein-alanine N-acetyltransferase
MYWADLTQNELATYLAMRSPIGDPGHHSSLLAYGGFWLMADEAHIATIASHPDWRGCGLGLTLMLALLDVAQAAGARLSTLEARAGNLSAQRLYEKLGFEIAGRRRHYYRDGEDGLIMTTPPLTAPEMQARLAAARTDALRRLEERFDETIDNRRLTTTT